MLRPLRLPLPFYANSRARCVAPPPIGDPANDGLDPRFPKGSWYQAYESLPSDGGTIYIEHGSYWGKPTATAHVTPLAKQGVRLTNFTDGSGNYWPGFSAFKPVVTIGVAAIGAPFGGVIAGILPGDPGDGAFPQPPEYDYGVWIAANTGPFAFYNINPGLTHGGWMIGVNGAPGQDPYDPANRMAQTTQFYFENCSTFDATSGDPQAQWNIGYSYFGAFKNITANSTIEAAADSERRAGMLVKGGTGSPDFILDGYNAGQGGIIYQPGSTSWRFDIKNARIEGDFVHALPPVVWCKALHASGIGIVSGLDQADGGGGGMKTLKIEHSGGFLPGQVIVNGLDPGQIDGSCDMRGGQAAFDASPGAAWPPRDNQIGFIRNSMWGRSDGPPYNIALACSPRRNLNPQHVDSGGETGALTPVPQAPTANLVYTASNATGPNGVAAPVGDRWGGTTGFKIASNNGSIASCNLFNADRAVVPGDSFYVSFWAKTKTGAGDGVAPAVFSLTGGVMTGSVYYGTNGNGEFTVPFTGESGLWQQYVGVVSVVSTSGAGAGTFRIQLQVMPNHDVTFCGVRIENVLVADGVMEATGLMQFGGPTWQGAVGSIATPPGALLVAGKLGIDNAVAATTLGSVVKKQQVFDREGNSLGYVPIYSSIS